MFGLSAKITQPRKRAGTKRRCGFATAVLRPEWLSIALLSVRYSFGLHRYCLLPLDASHRVLSYRDLPAAVLQIMDLR
ncbi:hypothetical protein [Yersinia pekkanenii]|uniref:hypothetical protein n=1 Tax=Yersinia pekkanenii TaxID=1288385 RepID=UPI000B17052C|nr:hypothetical protein [Yersinia pekkanenii]